jgi:hypothetical protein
MPAIHIKIDAKAMQRGADFTFAPGDEMAVKIDGRDVERDWVLSHDDPGVSVSQAEVLRDLVADCGVTLCLSDDGTLTVVEE